MSGAARVLAACAALAAFAACGGAQHTTKEIASVVITGDICATCSKSLVIHSNGKIEDISAGNGSSTADAPRVAEMLRSFPIDELATASKALPPITTPANVAILIVLFHDGQFVRAALPVGRPLYDGVGDLQRWTSNVDGSATAILLRARWRAIDDALAHRGLRSVVLESAGITGRCPFYTATFNASGAVTVRERGPACDDTRRLRGRFSRVVAAIVAGDGARMRTYYPILAEHTPGARITLNVRRGPYVSTAPDRTSWGPEFLATESRLDQIVRDLGYATARSQARGRRRTSHRRATSATRFSKR